MTGFPREQVPQSDQGESRARGDGDKDHKHGSFGVSVSDRSRNRRKPFVWVAIELVLDDLVVVKSNTDKQRAQERRCRESIRPALPCEGLGCSIDYLRTVRDRCMRPANPFSIERGHNARVLVLVSRRHISPSGNAAKGEAFTAVGRPKTAKRSCKNGGKGR